MLWNASARTLLKKGGGGCGLVVGGDGVGGDKEVLALGMNFIEVMLTLPSELAHIAPHLRSHPITKVFALLPTGSLLGRLGSLKRP